MNFTWVFFFLQDQKIFRDSILPFNSTLEQSQYQEIQIKFQIQIKTYMDLEISEAVFLSFGEEMSAYSLHGYCSFIFLTQGFKHLQRSMALTSTQNSIQIPAPFPKSELWARQGTELLVGQVLSYVKWKW